MADVLPPVLQHMKLLGHEVFVDGAYNLNLFGIRAKNGRINRFDDLLGCAYREMDNGPWRVAYWPATTDPGLYWLQNPMNVTGTAILMPGQYRAAYEVGFHMGKYKALVQRKAVRVWRDNDKDSTMTYGGHESVDEGLFGINIHASQRRSDNSGESSSVNKWSAGCQVHATQRGFNDMMRLVELALEEHPTWKRFTYTLLDQWW